MGINQSIPKSKTLLLAMPCLAAMVCLAPVARGQGDDNAVNERIPVDVDQLQSHWQVDCAASREVLSMQLQSIAPGSCVISPELQRQMQLCGFIFQPPGDAVKQACPDYRAIDHLIQSHAAEARCTALRAQRLQLLDCL